MEDNLFNFILILYFGFLVLYTIHPKPSILYKRVLQQNGN